MVIVDVSGAPPSGLEQLTAYYRQQLGGGERLLVGVDHNLEVAAAYDVQFLGATVVIGPEGRVRYRDQVTTEAGTLERVVREALG